MPLTTNAGKDLVSCRRSWIELLAKAIFNGADVRVKLLPQTQYFKIIQYNRQLGTVRHSYEDKNDSKTARFLCDFFASKERVDYFVACHIELPNMGDFDDQYFKEEITKDKYQILKYQLKLLSPTKIPLQKFLK